MKITAKVSLDPHDLWLGVYWKHVNFAVIDEEGAFPITLPFVPTTTLYICPFFCFVIRVTIEGRAKT